MKIDNKILKILYVKKNDGKYYDVSLEFNDNIQKHSIDSYVVQLEANGYVTKKVEGYLQKSQIPPGGDLSHANNSICKITKTGIDYYENFIKGKRTSYIAILAIIISGIATLFTALTYFYK